jgi:hypothetical protein
MPGFEFKPIHEVDLPEVARFLRAQQEQAMREDPAHTYATGDDLRWLTRNPDRREGIPLGETLRAPDGTLVGMILSVPRVYRLGDQQLLGLAAGNFFVDRSARLQGFFMIRRFLSCQGVDFWFANSCNAQSGPLWAKCAAAQTPESDVEYLLPIRLGPLLQEVALRRSWPRAAVSLLGVLGPLATPLIAARRPRHGFRFERSTDWDRLAAIAERNRNPDLLEPARTAPSLQWAYGEVADESAGASFTPVYQFADGRGREGWFSLRFDRRGRNQQIRSTRLVDITWPYQHMNFLDVLPVVVEIAASRSDVVSIRGQLSLGLREGVLGLRRRSLPAAEGYIVGRFRPTSELVGLADFPYIDRY